MKIIIGENKVKSLKKVRHTNELNATLSSIPISAKRVLFLALSQINSTKEIKINDAIYISASEYSSITGTDIKNSYRHLKDGADILASIGLRLEKEEVKSIQKMIGLKGEPSHIRLSLMDYCAYLPDEGRVAIRFSSAAAHYISSIIGTERKYTTQALISVVMLSTTHSTTLYQLIRKMIGLSIHRYGNSFSISINDLRREMGLVDENGELTWPEYPIFKRDVLNKAIKEISEKTEINNLTFEVSGKIGRKVSDLRFTYNVDEDKFKNSFKSEGDKFLDEFDKLFPPEGNQ